MPQILVLSSLFDHDSKIESSFVRMHNPTFWEACPIEICQPARPLLPFPYSKSQGLEFSPPRGDHKAQGLPFEGERTVPASLHLGCGHNDVEVEVHSTCVFSADFFVKTLWIHGIYWYFISGNFHEIWTVGSASSMENPLKNRCFFTSKNRHETTPLFQRTPTEEDNLRLHQTTVKLSELLKAQIGHLRKDHVSMNKSLSGGAWVPAPLVWTLFHGLPIFSYLFTPQTRVILLSCSCIALHMVTNLFGTSFMLFLCFVDGYGWNEQRSNNKMISQSKYYTDHAAWRSHCPLITPKSVKRGNLPESSPIGITATQTFESPKHVRISILRRAHSCHPSSPGSCKASCNSSGMHMMCPHVPSALCSLWGSTTSEKQWKFTSTMTCSLVQMRSPNSEISDFPNLPCIEAPQYPRHSWMPVRRCHPPHVLHRSCHGLRPASHMESRPLTKLITGVTRMGIGNPRKIEGSIILGGF